MEELVERVVPGGWGLALGIGVGAAILLGRGARPLAKTAIKGYLAAADMVQGATSGVREGFQDIYAEAKAERQAAPAPRPKAKEIKVASS